MTAEDITHTASYMAPAADSRQDGAVSERGRRTWMVGAVAVATGGLLVPGVAWAQDESPTLQDFHGTYVYAGGERQKQAIRDEIDDATEDLNIALRGLARRKIWKSQDPATRMSITVDGSDVSIVRSGGKAKFSGTIDGASFSVDDYRGRLHFRGGKIIVDITGGDQHTRVRFAIDPQTRTITMHTTIEHDMLPRPVRVQKTFRAFG